MPPAGKRKAAPAAAQPAAKQPRGTGGRGRGGGGRGAGRKPADKGLGFGLQRANHSITGLLGAKSVAAGAEQAGEPMGEPTGELITWDYHRHDGGEKDTKIPIGNVASGRARGAKRQRRTSRQGRGSWRGRLGARCSGGQSGSWWLLCTLWSRARARRSSRDTRGAGPHNRRC